jgi:hypothetical protein
MWVVALCFHRADEIFRYFSAATATIDVTLISDRPALGLSTRMQNTDLGRPIKW